MRPWIIVLLSAVGAMFVAAVLAGPELSDAARSGSWTTLLPILSGLVVAALAVYALCAMLLATGVLLAETLVARHRLGRVGEYGTPPPNDWTAALGANGLHHLIPRPVAETIPRTGTGDTIQLLGRFDPGAARREIARLHYIWLARTHFFSALIVLTALAGLGVAQDHGAARLPVDMIPTTPAILILVGLMLLAILSRIAVDVSVEPLVEAISQLPAEHAEIELLRRAVETLEAAAAAVKSHAPASTPLPPDRLDALIEEGHRALFDAVRDLSATTDALGATMRSSVDALGDAMSAATLRSPATLGNSDADTDKFSELQGAVEALTAVLERLTTLPDTAEEPPPIGTDLPARRPRAQEPRLARELRKLLQEIETAR
jgi:hypothetical protein